MECPECGYSSVTPLSSASDTDATHDISFNRHHIDLPAWLIQLENAVQSAWPKRCNAYAQVVVMMFSWAETDMSRPSLQKEMKRLQNVFKDLYHYEVRHCIIPSVDPDDEVLDQIRRLEREFRQPDNLLIIYYAGHARPGSPRGAPPIWQPRARKTSIEVNTMGIQNILARAQAHSPDVLLLYDSCHPLYAQQSKTDSARAVVECLFAGGFESGVPIPGLDSFTRALTQELGRALEIGQPGRIMVSELHRRVICRLQTWEPDMLWDKDDHPQKLEDGSTKFMQDRRITPNHLFLAVGKQPRSIILSPLSDSQKLELDKFEQTERDLACSWPKVLIAVRVREVGNIAEDLQDWLLRAPAGVCQFLGLYPSFSTLLLIQIPVEVWDLLPPCSAASFVGFIQGPEYPKLPKTPDPQLALSSELLLDQTSKSRAKELQISGASGSTSLTVLVMLPSLRLLLENPFFSSSAETFKVGSWYRFQGGFKPIHAPLVLRAQRIWPRLVGGQMIMSLEDAYGRQSPFILPSVLFINYNPNRLSALRYFQQFFHLLQSVLKSRPSSTWEALEIRNYQIYHFISSKVLMEYYTILLNYVVRLDHIHINWQDEGEAALAGIHAIMVVSVYDSQNTQIVTKFAKQSVALLEGGNYSVTKFSLC